jgi:hypothetical protein
MYWRRSHLLVGYFYEEFGLIKIMRRGDYVGGFGFGWDLGVVGLGVAVVLACVVKF